MTQQNIYISQFCVNLEIAQIKNSLYFFASWLCNMCACAQSCPVLCSPVNCILEASLSMGFSQQGYWSELPFPLGIFLTQELTPHVLHCRQILFFFHYFIYLFILLYRIVLVLPYIDLNLRRQILGCWATWCDLLGFPLYEL